MSPDAGLLNLVYVGAFLGNIVLLALLWHVGSLTFRQRYRRSTERWTIPAPLDRGRARTVRHEEAHPARVTRDAVIPGQ